MDIRPVGAEFF